MWRTIGNAGYLYARTEGGRFHGVPVTVIEPGEQWSGFGPLAIFNAYPRKNRNLMRAGYRDAKRALAARRRAATSGRGARRRGGHATETPAGAGEGARDAGELVSLQGSETKSES